MPQIPAAALSLMVFASPWALSAPASIALPGERAYPESLSSTQDGTLYVGNIAQGGVLRSSGSNSVSAKLRVPAGAPLQCSSGDVLPPVQPKAFAV